MAPNRAPRTDRRTKPTEGVFPLGTNDKYGRRTIPGVTAQLGERRLRGWTHGKIAFRHRTKNGVGDPFTYFHLVHALASIRPNHLFTARQLADWLNDHANELEWDAVTVGRILTDLMDNWNEANGDESSPVTTTRTWENRYYEVSASAHVRAVLYTLLDDLVVLGRKVKEAETAGQHYKKVDSPLLDCPSVTLRAEGQVA